MRRKTERTVTRMNAIRDQIDCSIRAYFLWDDLVSAITLAGAAERVLSDMQPQDGLIGVDAYSIRSGINLHIKPQYQKNAARLFRADYDFFRHADRDRSNERAFIEESVDYLILFALCSYEHLGGARTRDMTFFLTWFAAKHPTAFKEGHPIIPLAAKVAADTSKLDYYVLLVRAAAPTAGGGPGIMTAPVSRSADTPD